MATFKVGQRVRIVAYKKEDIREVPLGAEGIIALAMVDGMWGVDFIGYLGSRICASFQLAPLTDPGADAWATDAVRKVTKPLHVEPVVAPKVKA